MTAIVAHKAEPVRVTRLPENGKLRSLISSFKSLHGKHPVKSPLVSILLCVLVVLTSRQAGFAEELLTAKTPEEVGLSSDQLEKIPEIVQAAIDSKQTAGAIVLVLRQGKIAYQYRKGLQDIGTKVPMREDSLFCIASMTKPITTVAAMQLYEQGKFELNDPVSKYLPDFKDMTVYVAGLGVNVETEPSKRPITVRDLMCHTAGFARPGMSHPYFGEAYAKQLGGFDLTLDQYCQRLAKLPLMHHPRTQFEYSVSINVLGKLVEVWSGKTLDQYMKEEIFDPLDMKDTAFWISFKDADRRATIHGPFDSEDAESEFVAKHNAYTERFYTPPKMPAGGSGLVSTARDYARFLQMVLNQGTLNGKQILKPETIALMTCNHVPEESLPIQLDFERTGCGFGLGWACRCETDPDMPSSPVGECRWGGLFSTRSWFSPKDQLAVIVMQQQYPTEALLENQIKPLVYSAIIPQGVNVGGGCD